jgi:hypothetical protein
MLRFAHKLLDKQQQEKLTHDDLDLHQPKITTLARFVGSRAGLLCWGVPGGMNETVTNCY